VARTVNPEAQRVRREAFLDVAQRLIQNKGYDHMSIQDVLNELETSRGALYHYFDSKEALLDGVVERLADHAMAAIEPILADPSLPALRKLERVLAGIAQYKSDNKALLLGLMEVWKSDANALAREKLRRLSTAKMRPILSAVIRQGIEEGVVKSDTPEETAQVLMVLVQGYQDLAVEQFIARQAGTITFDEVMRAQRASTAAFERILGVPPGSVTLVDESTMRLWFG
jgi:AcrR family transcriptional regulator